MIKIEITDPHLMPKQALLDTAAYLMKFAGAELRAAPVATSPANSDKPVSTDGCAEGDKSVSAYKTLPVKPLRDLTPSQAVPPTPTSLLDIVPPPPGLPDFDLLPRPVKYGVELDTNGVPWDARIHSRTKSKNANGTWKLQRGIDLNKVDEISEQLKTTTQGIPLEKITTPSNTLDWEGLMLKITGLIQHGHITQETVVKAVNSVGMPSLPVLPTRPELIPRVAAYLDNYLAEANA